MKARSLFRFSPDARLRDADAARKPLGNGAKSDDKEAAQRLLERVAALQPMLHAQGKHRVLLVLQGMDTSGKDGAIRSLFNAINPVGLRAVSFKAPTEIELATTSCGACTGRRPPKESWWCSTAATMRTC